MYSDLIIGFDGSVASRDAVALGRRLARATGARPTVIYVRSPEPVTADIPEVPDDYTWGASVATTLDEARAMLADVPTARFLGVAETSVARVLHRAAEEVDAALIVLGATNRSGVGRVIPGTTADAVLHAAPCAVAIAPFRSADRTQPGPFGVVAAAVDGGDESERVANVAGRIARSAGATLRLVTVVRPGSIDFGSLDEVVHESARALLERLARGAGPELEIELRAEAAGDVAHGVARNADGVDVLVIGSRGYGPLRRIFHGSATTKILQAAACPVIVVPRRTAERADDAVVPLAATVAGRDTGEWTHHHDDAR